MMKTKSFKKHSPKYFKFILRKTQNGSLFREKIKILLEKVVFNKLTISLEIFQKRSLKYEYTS